MVLSKHTINNVDAFFGLKKTAENNPTKTLTVAITASGSSDERQRFSGVCMSVCVPVCICVCVSGCVLLLARV